MQNRPNRSTLKSYSTYPIHSGMHTFSFPRMAFSERGKEAREDPALKGSSGKNNNGLLLCLIPILMHAIPFRGGNVLWLGPVVT